MNHDFNFRFPLSFGVSVSNSCSVWDSQFRIRAQFRIPNFGFEPSFGFQLRTLSIPVAHYRRVSESQFRLPTRFRIPSTISDFLNFDFRISTFEFLDSTPQFRIPSFLLMAGGFRAWPRGPGAPPNGPERGMHLDPGARHAPQPGALSPEASNYIKLHASNSKHQAPGLKH